MVEPFMVGNHDSQVEEFHNMYVGIVKSAELVLSHHLVMKEHFDGFFHQFP